MSPNTTKFYRCYFKLTTRFGPCSEPSSDHNFFCYSRKLYSISHKIYQSKTQRDLVIVQYSNAVHDQVKICIYHKANNIIVIIYSRYLNWSSRLVKQLSLQLQDVYDFRNTFFLTGNKGMEHFYLQTMQNTPYVPNYSSQKTLQTSMSMAHSYENQQHCCHPQITTTDFLPALKL